jgi:hypothetical protein
LKLYRLLELGFRLHHCWGCKVTFVRTALIGLANYGGLKDFVTSNVKFYLTRLSAQRERVDVNDKIV